MAALATTAVAVASATEVAAETEVVTKAAVAAAPPLVFPPLGLGAWAWGDALFWGYRPSEDSSLRETFDYAVANGVTFFDTAELYGLGRSEDLIGKFRKEAPGPVTVASKFA